MKSLKQPAFWLTFASVLQLLTAVVHAFSLVSDPQPQNPTEAQLIELMTTYRMDAGMGFTPNMQELFTALSFCFTLLALMGGLINLFLLRRHAPPALTKGITGIQVAVFGACFAAMAWLTFLPPILLTGLIFVTLLTAWLLMQKVEAPSAPS